VTDEPIPVGLVGTGPWARMFHAPMLAGGPQTRLVMVHGRRRDAAEALAAEHGARATDDLDELVGSCQAVAFAVPPDVQAALAPVAARAGRALLLEKPVGLDLATAQRLAGDVEDVPTMLLLRARFSPHVRDFLALAAGFRPSGITLMSANGALLGSSPFGTPWRHEHGALLDIGPHALDLVEAAAGAIVDLTATGSSVGWVALTTQHASGAVGQLSLSLRLGVEGGLFSCTLYGPEGILDLPDPGPDSHDAAMALVRAEFAEVVRTGTSHPLDVHRGVELQVLLEQAATQLAD